MPDKYFGKYTGIIIDNRDTAQLGELVVSVPSIFPRDTVTARAALPFGFFFVPEVGAKVWVEFEGGESGLPLWTGVQYVPGEWPVEARATPPQKRTIITPSGHFITFNDKRDEETILISSPTRIRIECAGNVEINGSSVTINGRPVAPLPRPL